MFAEYLASRPLEELLTALPACPFPDAEDRAAWEGLPEARRASLRALAGRYRSEPYARLTAAQYMAFVRDGNRGVMETPYFQRRRKLIAAALGVCESGSNADMDAVTDGIWLICEETSWVISAHNGGEHDGVLPRRTAPLPDPEKPYVDLFAAQTAMVLSLVCRLLAARLDAVTPLIRQRVRREVERRVLTPFELRDDFWWMGVIRQDLCNWTPWIVSNVMLSSCAWVRELPRLRALLERGCAMLDRYLDALPGDGGCDEGPGYWSMAGGALLDCLALLEDATGGKMALWGDKKLGNVLRYPLNAWLGGAWFVNYADCDARPDIPGERLQFAGERLGDDALRALGLRFVGDPCREIDDTPQLWRLLNALFRPGEAAPGEAVPPADVWLPDLQLRVVRRGGLALAVQGGVNAGSHSHNDCGSFMLYADGEPQIVDAGNMTYSRKTFSEERYTLWNTRGKNHNAPMIGDFEQVNGWEHKARDVRPLPDGLSMDLAEAYPEAAGVLRCHRRVRLEGGGCLLTDAIRTRKAMPVTEVFLLRHRPEVRGAALVAGALRVACGAEAEISVEEIPVDDPRMARSFPGSLWRAAFTLAPAREHELTFHIERNDP